MPAGTQSPTAANTTQRSLREGFCEAVDVLSEDIAFQTCDKTTSDTAGNPSKVQTVLPEPENAPAKDQSDSLRKFAISVLVLATLILTVFGRTLTHQLLTWDDDIHITANPAFNPLTWHSLSKFWQAPYENLYIPVSYSLFAAEVALTDLLFSRDASGAIEFTPIFRSASLGLHWLNCVLVFVLMTRVGVRWGSALAGAIVFAVHPLQVESVAWTSETRGLLATSLGLTALWCHLRSQEPTARKFNWSAGALIALLLALLSKPSIAAIALMAVCYDLIWLRRSWKQAAVTMALFGIATLAIAVVTRTLQPSGESTTAVPLWFRPAIALDSLGWYLVKFCWPLNLSMDYGRSPRSLWQNGLNYGLLAIPLMLLPGLWWIKAERRIWMAALWFVAGLAPVLGIVSFGFQEISTVADRYIYVAMLGPALAAAVVWDRWNSLNFRRAFTFGLAVLSLMAWNAAGIWRDSATLYAQALEVNPHSWIALHNQASLFAKSGDYPRAIRQLRHVLQLRPRYPQAWLNLAVCLRANGQTADAIDALRQGAAIEPDNVDVHLALGQNLANGDQAAADAAFDRSLELAPKSPQVLTEVGEWYARTNRSRTAFELFARAARADPTYWQAKVNLALQLQNRGQHDEALDGIETLLTDHPQRPEIRFQYGLMLARVGRLKESVSALSEARALAVRHKNSTLQAAVTRELVVAHNSQGNSALEQQQWTEAESAFQAALELDPTFAAGYFNLGRALAAQGESFRAKQAFERTLALVPPDSPAVSDIKEQLSALRSRTVRDSPPPR